METNINGNLMYLDVYEKLAQHLDNLPPGYPRTESGVEMRILRRLFTPKEAGCGTAPVPY